MVHRNEEARSKVSVGTAALLEYLEEQQNNTNNLDHENMIKEEYTFCLGADAFMDLTAGKWKESERVLELLQGRFLVLNRIECTNNSENGLLANGETSIPEALKARVDSVPGAQLLSVPALGAVSSSRVREAVAAKEWEMLESDEWIHPAVLTYIREHGLYSVA